MPDVQHLALTVSAVGGAMATVYGGYRVAWPRIVDRWNNRRAARVERMLGELVEGGKNATRERGVVASAVSELRHEFALFRAEVSAVIAADPDIATFAASPTGLLTEASKTYLRWTGRSFADLERWGWINAVFLDDRKAVREEWDAAVKDQRQSVMRYRLLGADGEPFWVLATATPIPDGATTCEKFAGHLKRIPAP